MGEYSDYYLSQQPMTLNRPQAQEKIGFNAQQTPENKQASNQATPAASQPSIFRTEEVQIVGNVGKKALYTGEQRMAALSYGPKFKEDPAHVQFSGTKVSTAEPVKPEETKTLPTTKVYNTTPQEVAEQAKLKRSQDNADEKVLDMDTYDLEKLNEAAAQRKRLESLRSPVAYDKKPGLKDKEKAALEALDKKRLVPESSSYQAQKIEDKGKKIAINA